MKSPRLDFGGGWTHLFGDRRDGAWATAAVMLFVVAVIGFGMALDQARDRREDRLRQLDMSVRLVAAHLADRLRGRAALASALGRLVPTGIGEPAAVNDRIARWMRDLQYRYGAAGVALLGADGKVTIGIGEALATSEALAADAAAVAVTGEPMLYRIERRADSKRSPDTWVDFLVPQSVPFGGPRSVVLLRLSAEQELQGLLLAAGLEGSRLSLVHRVDNRWQEVTTPPGSGSSTTATPTLVEGVAMAASGTRRDADDRNATLFAMAPVGSTGWVLQGQLDPVSAGAPSSFGARFSLVVAKAALASLVFCVWRLGQAVGARAAAATGTDATPPATRPRRDLQWLEQYALDAVIVVDEAGQVIEANERAAALFGLPREALLGGPAGDLLDAAHLQQDTWRDPSRTPRLVEALHRRVDGTVLPVEASLQRLELAGARHTQVVLRDVTHRFNHEANLQASVARLRALAELAPVGIFLSDLRGTRLYANLRMAQMTGWPHPLRGGMIRRDIIHPRDRDRAGVEMDAAVAECRAARVEMRLIWPDGSVRSVVLQIEPERAPEGGIVGFMGMLTDLTTLRTLHEATQAPARLLEAVLDSPFVCAVVIDGETGVIVTANPTMDALLGHSPGHLAGRHWSEVFPEEERERNSMSVQAIYRDAVDAYRSRRRVLHRSGRVISVQFDVRVLRASEGRVERILLVARPEAEEAAAEASQRPRAG